MLKLSDIAVPIQQVPINRGVELFLKREDLIHPEISGNKFWKLYYNINQYLIQKPDNPIIITFGGAFSNHISAVAALGNDLNLPTLGIIRGEELHEKWENNPTLKHASEKGMQFRFITRSDYQNKVKLSAQLQTEFPDALIIPEGGNNALAVQGFQHVLGEQTARFDYICTATGTGGTLAGLSKFAEDHQKILGFAVVKDASLHQTVENLYGRNNFELVDASFGGYGKLDDEVVSFVNWFYREYKIPLDPIYTGKMMLALFKSIEVGSFEKGSKILAIHTGGLQGIVGANQLLSKNNKERINF